MAPKNVAGSEEVMEVRGLIQLNCQVNDVGSEASNDHIARGKRLGVKRKLIKKWASFGTHGIKK